MNINPAAIPLQVIADSVKELNINALQRCLDNTTASYKFLWFLAILDIVESELGQYSNENLLNEEGLRIDFDEIGVRMLSKAWAPSIFYKLSFGLSDQIPSFLKALQAVGTISVDKKTDETNIFQQLSKWKTEKPQDFRKSVSTFYRFVPYRFLTPWLAKSTDKWKEIQQMSEDPEYSAPYTFVEKNILLVRPQWVAFFVKYKGLLTNFAYWEFARYLQKRNPSVPAIVDKLIVPVKRESLAKQRDYWETYLSVYKPREDIFGQPVSKDSYDLDHFIPWSFVVHNQIWNLIPINPELNASKSNRIPSVERFAENLSCWQHDAFHLNLDQKEKGLKVIKDEYAMIGLDENSSQDDFTEIIIRQLKPLETTAINSGFEVWQV